MPRCRLHGPYEDYCYECRKSAEQAEEERADILSELGSLKESNEELADAINNPGEFGCPSCKFRTLRRDASRCPRCRGEVPDEYWSEVRRRESEARHRAVEQAAKAAEERERLARESEAVEKAIALKLESTKPNFLLFSILLWTCTLGIWWLVATGIEAAVGGWANGQVGNGAGNFLGFWGGAICALGAHVLGRLLITAITK